MLFTDFGRSTKIVSCSANSPGSRKSINLPDTNWVGKLGWILFSTPCQFGYDLLYLMLLTRFFVRFLARFPWWLFIILSGTIVNYFIIWNFTKLACSFTNNSKLFTRSSWPVEPMKLSHPFTYKQTKTLSNKIPRDFFNAMVRAWICIWCLHGTLFWDIWYFRHECSIQITANIKWSHQKWDSIKRN